MADFQEILYIPLQTMAVLVKIVREDVLWRVKATYVIHFCRAGILPREGDL